MVEINMRRELAVVVPCYNVGDRLKPVAEALLAQVDRVIIVDDGCTDGSLDAVRDLSGEIIIHPHNRGKGNALLTGFRRGLEYQDVAVVAVVDADGQHDPSELPHLYAELIRDGADRVIGARSFESRRVPWPSRIGNKVTRFCTTMVLRRRLPDTQSGFRLFTRQLLEEVVSSVEGGRYETEMEILVMAVRRGYKVSSVPIRTIYEDGNPTSHFDKVGDSFRVLTTLLRASLGRSKR